MDRSKQRAVPSEAESRFACVLDGNADRAALLPTSARSDGDASSSLMTIIFAGLLGKGLRGASYSSCNLQLSYLVTCSIGSYASCGVVRHRIEACCSLEAWQKVDVLPADRGLSPSPDRITSTVAAF